MVRKTSLQSAPSHLDFVATKEYIDTKTLHRIIRGMANPYQTIFTFGYSGRDPSELMQDQAQLDALVVDVRYRPFSKDPRWTKENLKELLGENYRWIGKFGNTNYKGSEIRLDDPEMGLKW